MEIKMVQCPNGHYYNVAMHSVCPECGQRAGGRIGATMGVGTGAGIGVTVGDIHIHGDNQISRQN